MKINRQEPSALSPQNNRRARAGADLVRRLVLLALILAAGAGLARAQERMFVLNEATSGTAYSVQVATAGAAPYSWQVIRGALPPGLTLNTDGTLSGTPTGHSATPYRFRVRVTDSSAPPRTSEQWLSVIVAPAAPPTSLIGPTGNDEAAPAPPFVLTTSTSDEETIAVAQQFDAAPPRPTFYADTNPANVNALKGMIAGTIGTRLSAARAVAASTNEFQLGDYIAMHVIVWKPLNENKSDPDREIWALFKAVKRAGDPNNVEWEPVIDEKKNKDIFDTRILGRRRVVILLAHLDTPAAWDVKYKVVITRKTPTPVQHALDLAGNILGASASGGGAGPRRTKDVWGARLMLDRYTASDIAVSVNAVTVNGRPVEQSKEHTKIYDNEGKYHWDVSIGLPVQGVRQLTFKSDGGRVFAESKEKQSVYGFLDFYPWKVDLKGDDYLTKPHFIFGVPLASKPLQRPFVGVGSGVFKTPIKFNFFAGIVFIRERVPGALGEGSAATTGQLEADLRTRWVRKGMFGISLPVGQIKDAIKK